MSLRQAHKESAAKVDIIESYLVGKGELMAAKIVRDQHNLLGDAASLIDTHRTFLGFNVFLCLMNLYFWWAGL